MPLARSLVPLTKLAETLKFEDIPHPEALTKIVEANVHAQVENVVNSEPVQAAWAQGRRNLFVHGIVVYELEYIPSRGPRVGSAAVPFPSLSVCVPPKSLFARLDRLPTTCKSRRTLIRLEDIALSILFSCSLLPCFSVGFGP